MKNTQYFKGIISSSNTLLNENLMTEKLILCFEDFGKKDGGIYIDNYYIPPESIKIDLFNKKYYIRHKENDVDIRAELQVVGGEGHAHITVNNKDYIVELQPWALPFKTKISINAGVTYDKTLRKFNIDTNSAAWKNANWKEGELEFAYDVYDDKDPVMPLKKIETQFKDLKFTDLAPMENTSSDRVVMSRENVLTMQFTNLDSSILPEERKDNDIKTVFPSYAEFYFDELGSKFYGAYYDCNNNIYAIQGEFISDFKADSSLALHSFKKVIPLTNKITSISAESNLDIYGLIAMNPIVTDENNNRYDAPGKESMDDFYKIILNYMDDDLRKKYYGEQAPALNSVVRSIAEDSKDAKDFYKELQVPFLASSLGKMTGSDYVKQINTMRAEYKLKSICANSNVYKRQSDKLYRYHFIQKYGDMQKYLDDQKYGNYDQKIKDGIKYIKSTYVKKFGDSTEESVQNNLKEILEDLDKLEKWGVNQKLYWAFNLYYYLMKTYIPMLEMKMLSGTLAQSVSEEIKNYSALFEMLEGNVTNPDQITFGSAFMDALRVSLLTSVIPQMADYPNMFEDFSEVYYEILNQFCKDHVNSGDEAIREATIEIQSQLQNREVCEKYLDALKSAIAVSGAGSSWKVIINNFEKIAGSKIQGYVAGFASIIALSYAASIIGMVFIQKSYKEMTVSEKVYFFGACSAFLVGGILYIGLGIAKVCVVWHSLSGFWDACKMFLGVGEVANRAAVAIDGLTSSTAKFFLKESTSLESRVSSNIVVRLFGNTFKAVIGTIGAVLSIVSIITTSLAIKNDKTSLEIAMDSLLLASSCLQLVAIVGNFALSAFAITAGVLPALCTAVGALAFVAAVAGFIIGIVIMTTQKPDDPFEDFVLETLSGTNLRMEYECALEYISTEAMKGSTAVNGISFFNKAENKALALNEDNSISLKEFDYSNNMVWSLSTDENGDSYIYTTHYINDDTVEAVYLTVEDNKLKSVPSPKYPERKGDGRYDQKEIEEYNKQMEKLKWSGDCTCKAEKEGSIVKKSTFYLKHNTSNKFLNLDNEVSLGDSKTDITIKSERIAVSDIVCSPNPFEALVYGKSQYVMTYFKSISIPDAVWRVSPDLMPGFNFYVDKDTNVAYIKQDDTAELKPCENQIFTILADVPVEGKTITNSCKLSISIADRE